MADLAEETLASIGERWRNLTITNDFVFCKTMLDADLCKEVLEAILGVPIDRVEYVGRQEPLDTSTEGKSIRLDVYVRDEKGTVYNVEMQSCDTHELPQRARYYHSLLTANQLRHGSSYRSLKDVYVIFICNFDLFACGRRVYSFQHSCDGLESLKLGDGTRTIFLAANAPAAGDGDGRLDELLDYVSTGRVSGGLSARLATAVADVLDNQKWRLEFMLLEVRDQMNFDRGEKHGLEQGRLLGLAEGIEQGRETGLAEGMERGREVGIVEGQKHGEERLARLLTALMKDGRQADVQAVLCDEVLRENMYRHYGVI